MVEVLSLFITHLTEGMWSWGSSCSPGGWLGGAIALSGASSDCSILLNGDGEDTALAPASLLHPRLGFLSLGNRAKAA